MMPKTGPRRPRTGVSEPSARRRAMAVWFGVLLVLHEDEFVGVGVFEVQAKLLLAEEPIDGPGRHGHFAPAGVEALEIHLLGLEILGHEPHRIALDAGVDVLGDEDDAHALLHEAKGAADDAVVRRIGGQPRAKFLVLLENHADAPAGLRKIDALGKFSLQAKRIEMTDDGSGVAAQIVGVGLELIQFLDDIEGDDDLVVGEHEQGVGIVQQNVRVQNEMLDVSVGMGHGKNPFRYGLRSVCIRRVIVAEYSYVSLST